MSQSRTDSLRTRSYWSLKTNTTIITEIINIQSSISVLYGNHTQIRSIHSKSKKVCGTAFSVKTKLRKKCGSFLGHLGSFGVVLWQFGAFLGHFWSYLGHFGSFLAIFGPLRGIFGQICGKFKSFLGSLGAAELVFTMIQIVFVHKNVELSIWC